MAKISKKIKKVFGKLRSKNFFGNFTKYIVIAAVILMALAAADALYYFSKAGTHVPGTVSAQKAGEKAVSYINSLLNGQATASLVESKEENGLYRVKAEINGEDHIFYVTKNAKLLFGQANKIPDKIREVSKNKGFPKSDKPKVQLFVMSFCPYGNQAEQPMKEVAELFGDKADIELHYVIYKNYQNGSKDFCIGNEEKYCSMHGINEVNQDIRELCVQKYQKDKFWDFIENTDKECSVQDINTCWKKAAKKAGVDINKVIKCQKQEGLRLITHESILNEKYNINASPQLLINGQEYQGARNAESYKTAICSAFNSAPKECEKTLSGNKNASAGGGCK